MTPEMVNYIVTLIENDSSLSEAEKKKMINGVRASAQQQNRASAEQAASFRDSLGVIGREMKRLREEEMAGIDEVAAKRQQAFEQLVKLKNLSAEEEKKAIEEGKKLILADAEAKKKALADQAQAADAAGKATRDWLSSQGFGKKLEDSYVGKILKGGPDSFMGIADALAEAIEPQRLFASGLLQMEKATVDLFKRFDDAASGLNKTTGATGKFNDMLYDAQEQSKLYNVTVEDAATSIKELHTQLSTFTEMDKESQEQLVETTARFEAYGVSIATTAGNFDVMIRGMGMSADAANNAQTELLALSDTISVGMDQIASDFKSSAGELAKYGPDAVKVFTGVAAAAKATGLEVSKLMGLAKQFDTFEGAATHAGKLNAILGGGVINSMDLLNAEEDERIRLLIQSIHLSGKSWEHLNRFEKQAIASAAGISDMTEANKMFSMSLSAYDEMQSKADAATISQKKMEERAAAGISFQEKLARIGEAFAVAFMPVLDALRWFLDLVLELNDMTSGLFIPTMVALIGAVALLTQVQNAATIATMISTGVMAIKTAMAAGMDAAMKSLTVSESAATITTAGMTVAIQGMVLAIGPAIPLVIALAFALGGMGLAVAGMALAFAAPFIALGLVIQALKDVFVAILEMPDALARAVVGLLAFAIAGAMAMNILAAGLAGAVIILIPFTLQMAVIAPALMQFGLALSVAVLPIYLFAQALGELGEALTMWGDVTFGQILKAGAALLAFTLILIPIAQPLGIAAAIAGLGLVLFGAGLEKFGKSFAAFGEVTLGQMMMAALAIVAFTLVLIPIAQPLALAAAMVGLPLILLGAGLVKFAEGIKEFGDWALMLKGISIIAVSLAVLTVALIPLAKPLAIGAAIVSLPLILLGTALTKFAEGITAFGDWQTMAIALALVGASIAGITLLLVKLAVPLIVVGFLTSGPLYLLGQGLLSFAEGVAEFSDVTFLGLLKAVTSIVTMVALMATPAFMFGVLAAGYISGIPLMIIGKALKEFAMAIFEFNFIAATSILKAVASLFLFTSAIIRMGPHVALAMAVISVPLLMLGFGLMEFAEALWEFNYISGEAILTAVAAVALFLNGLMAKLGLASIAVAVMGPVLLSIGLGLYLFGKSLQKFNTIGKEAIFAAIASVTAFSLMAARFGLVAGIMSLFGAALLIVGKGLEALAVGFQEMYGLDSIIQIALPTFFASLMMISPLSGLALLGIGAGLMLIAAALNFMPIDTFFLIKPLIAMITALMDLAFALVIVFKTISSLTSENAMNLVLVATGLMYFVTIATILSPAMAIISAGIMALGLALRFLPEEKVIAIGYVFQGLGQFGAAMATEGAQNSFDMLSKTVSAISAADKETAQAITESITQMAVSIAVVNTVAAQAPAAAAPRQQGEGKDVVLVLNERELGRAIEAVLEKRHNLRID